VGRVLQQAHRGQSLRHAIVALLIMGGIGLLVLSPAYVALLVEGRGYSHRAGTLPYDVAVTNNALHPLALWTIVNPKLALSDALDYTDISSRSLYMGALIPLLAVFALFRRRDWLRWTLFVTGLLFVAAALGRTLPVRGWLYDFVPLTRYFRHPSMFRAYLIVAMALLALFGASEVAERVNATVKRSLAIALVVIATGDALATASLMRPVMYNPSANSWTRLDAQHVTSVDLSSRGLLRVPDNGNNFTFTPKQPAASGYAAITGPLVREYMSEPVLVDAATSATRLWFNRTAVQSERSSGCLAQLRTAAKRLGAPPLVVHPPEKMENSAGSPTQTCATDFAVLPAAERVPASAVQVIEYTPQRLRLRVHVPDAGWLLVTDSWSRGWTAVINGRAAAIAGGNFLFRAVQVGAGTNSIDFSYRPFGYPWLLALSWGTLAAVAVVTWRQSQTT
jgi:hypothetical protein